MPKLQMSYSNIKGDNGELSIYDKPRSEIQSGKIWSGLSKEDKILLLDRSGANTEALIKISYQKMPEYTRSRLVGYIQFFCTEHGINFKFYKRKKKIGFTITKEVIVN